MLPAAAAFEAESPATAAGATAEQAKEEAVTTVSAAVSAQTGAENAAGRQLMADEVARQGQAAEELHQQEQPANTEVVGADSDQQRHQATEDNSAEARRLRLACASARFHAKKVAAKRAKAETAETSKAESASAENSQARQPVRAGKAKAQKADSTVDKSSQAKNAQKTNSAQAEKGQAKGAAATKAAKGVEVHEDDAATAQTIRQAHQTLAHAAKPEAARADAFVERDQLGTMRLVSNADGQQSNARADSYMPSVTAAAAAPSEGHQEFAGTPSIAVGAGTAAVAVSRSKTHLPLISIQDDGRSCRVVAGAIPERMCLFVCLSGIVLCGCLAMAAWVCELEKD